MKVLHNKDKGHKAAITVVRRGDRAAVRRKIWVLPILPYFVIRPHRHDTGNRMEKKATTVDALKWTLC